MSIRFPMIRERTGRRTGPRYRRVVDCSGLSGAAFCAAKSINLALMYRSNQQPVCLPPERRQIAERIARLGMRVMALWARVFVGQVDQHDPRLVSAETERVSLVRAYCAESERSAA